MSISETTPINFTADYEDIIQAFQQELSQLQKKEDFLKEEMGASNFTELSVMLTAELSKRNLHPSLIEDFLNHQSRIFRLEQIHQQYLR